MPNVFMKKWTKHDNTLLEVHNVQCDMKIAAEGYKAQSINSERASISFKPTTAGGGGGGGANCQIASKIISHPLNLIPQYK